MPLTDQQVINWLELKIQEKKPFSLLRYGDGEGIFGFTDNGVSRRYAQASIKHWGEIPKERERLYISRNIKNSYRYCDMAGLPFGFDGFFWRYALNNFLAMPVKHELCSINIHLGLHHSGSLFKWVDGADVFYIGCRDVDGLLYEMGAYSVDSIHISPQYRFEGKKPTMPFYKQVKEVEQEILKKNLNGKLCFLAAGVAGKHLGNLMRDRGGMVIDVGSVMDLWVNKVTRSWIKEELV